MVWPSRFTGREVSRINQAYIKRICLLNTSRSHSANEFFSRKASCKRVVLPGLLLFPDVCRFVHGHLPLFFSSVASFTRISPYACVTRCPCCSPYPMDWGRHHENKETCLSAGVEVGGGEDEGKGGEGNYCSNQDSNRLSVEPESSILTTRDLCLARSTDITNADFA